MKKKSEIQPLIAKTNIVELKKDCDYLFVFDETSGLKVDEIQGFFKLLKEEGYKGIGLRLIKRSGLSVYETKKEKSKV